MRPNLRLIKDKKGAQKAEPTKPKGECYKCKGNRTSSFLRGTMPWKKCLDCMSTWGLGGDISLLAKTGQDRHEVLRELLQEPTLISVSEEVQRNVHDWEQDLEITERNDSLYNRF